MLKWAGLIFLTSIFSEVKIRRGNVLHNEEWYELFIFKGKTENYHVFHLKNQGEYVKICAK